MNRMFIKKLPLITIMALATSNIAIASKPIAPINAGAYNATSSSIRLSFKDMSTNEIGFRVYSNGVVIATASSKPNTGEYQYLNLNGLTPSSLYTVQIKAYNADGESHPLVKSFRTLPSSHQGGIQTPKQPGADVSTWGATETTVRLAFIDNSTNEDGFRVEEIDGTVLKDGIPAKDASGSYQYVTLENLNSGSLYQIKVFAYNANGDSLPSNVKAFRTKEATVIPSNAFKIKIKTDNEGNTSNTKFEIPTKGSGYNYTVDCDDDGTPEAIGVHGNYICQYNTPGIYTISITGTFPQIYFNNYSSHNDSDSKKLLAIVQWGDTKWRSMERAFMGCTSFNGEAALDKPDFSELTSLQRMFFDSSFNQEINDWNLSHVQDISRMFMSNHVFNRDISNWDVSSVTDASGMFSHASAFNQNINDWNTSSFTTTAGMFYDADAYNQDLNKWDVSSVTDMNHMFYDTANFNANIRDWNVSSVQNMSGMFRNSLAFTQDISQWDVHSLTNASYMFYQAIGFSNNNLSLWDVTKVTNHTSFSQGWGTGNVEPLW